MVDTFFVEIAASACDEKKARNTTAIYIEPVSSIAEWILITEGQSDVQVRAIVKSVESNLGMKTNLNLLRKEGLNESKWALLDYGELIVNVFQPEERKFYDLERFWNNGQIYQFDSPRNKLLKL